MRLQQEARFCLFSLRLLSLLGKSSHASFAEKHPASALVLSTPCAAEATMGFLVQPPSDKSGDKGRGQ